MIRKRVRRTDIRSAGLAVALAAVGALAASPAAGRAEPSSVAAAGGEEPSSAAAAAAPVQAVWQPHEVDFTYMGVTAQYSCDGLEDKLRLLLRAAGARADAKVHARGCDYGPGRVSRILRAKLTFHSLVPADAVPPPPAPPPSAPAKQLGRDAPKLKKDPPAPEQAVGAWREVEFRTNTPRGLDAGDCELVDQFQRDVLPKFTTQDVQGRARCTPYQKSILDIRVKFRVLAPLPSADARGAGATAKGPATG